MEVNVTFTYLNRTIQVLCKEDDEMETMFKQFTSKLDDDSETNDSDGSHDACLVKVESSAGFLTTATIMVIF
jgi:hypothetical protein